jgi:hypothetical protein
MTAKLADPIRLAKQPTRPELDGEPAPGPMVQLTPELFSWLTSLTHAAPPAPAAAAEPAKPGEIVDELAARRAR